MKTINAVKTAKAIKIIFLFSVFLLLLLNSELFSQNVLKVPADFPTIAEAYNSIEIPLTTAWEIEIQNTYNPGLEPAITLGFLDGASSSNTVSIFPADNASKTVGSLVLDGAKYVIFNGTYRGGTGSLTFQNTSSTGNTILLKNDACFNKITNCSIYGQNTSSTSGVIVIGTTTGTTGNRYNSFLNNKISSVGANFPNILLYSEGTTLYPNSDNVISQNEFHDFSQYGIYITSTGNGNNWTIGGNNSSDGNHFYQMYSITSTQVAIFFRPGGNSSGNVIGYNLIGGSDRNCAGSAWEISGTEPFSGIKAVVSATTTGVLIQYNTIQNFDIISTDASTSFNGILADSGSMTIDHNTIGHNSTTNSIQSAAPSLVCGIYSKAVYNTNITNNTISNITLTSTSNNSPLLKGIKQYNMLGRDQGKITISGNSIHDLSNSGTTPYGEGTVVGITYTDSSNSSNGEISSNTIHNLNCDNTTGSNVYMAGIEINDYAYKVNVFKNKVYDLYNSNTSSSMIGGMVIRVNFGSLITQNVTMYNNMMHLNTNQNVQVYGIWDLSTDTNTFNLNLYYNSIYLAGNVSSGNNKSSCFNRGFTGIYPASLPARANIQIVDNILVNTRSGGSGKHYSIINSPDSTISASSGWTQNAANYNFMVTLNNNAVCGWGQGSGINDYSFCNWKMSTGTTKQDSNSWYINSASFQAKRFFSDTSVADLSIKSVNGEAWYVKGKGVAGSFSGLVNSDFQGNNRTTTYKFGTCIGASEFTPISNPLEPVITGRIAINDSSIISLGGKQIGVIRWTGGTSLPDSIVFEYFTGSNPPGNFGGNFGNCYWRLYPISGGTDFSYTITLNYDPAIMGYISGENYIRLGKSEDGVHWLHYGLAVVNTSTKTVSFNFSTFSYFALSDENSPMPVELASFTANVAVRDVLLKWQTDNEVNNSGFDVQRSDNNNWKSIGFVEGKNLTQNSYTFTDSKLNSGTYKYRLKQIDNNGNFKIFDLTNSVKIGTPDKFSLMQNYPNPFNPVTRISYNLPANSFVSLKVYDMTGKEVATLVNENQVPGYYDVDFSAGKFNLSSGIYFYRLSAGTNTKILKMALIK